MENSEKMILEALLKQNKLIIMQNSLIIKKIDMFNEGSTYHHSVGYNRNDYEKIQEEATMLLDEIDEIQKKLIK